MTTEEWVTQYPNLREDIRSTLAIHVDNRTDVPAILKLILATIRQTFEKGNP